MQHPHTLALGFVFASALILVSTAPTRASAAPASTTDGAIAEAAGRQAGAECKAAYGTTVCGYHCTAAYGQVRCARTPFGACDAAYGRVACWDPMPSVVRRFRRSPPVASCMAAYGDIACGYQCKAGFGEVRCAGAPDGVCEAASGHVTCTP